MIGLLFPGIRQTIINTLPERLSHRNPPGKEKRRRFLRNLLFGHC